MRLGLEGGWVFIMVREIFVSLRELIKKYMWVNLGLKLCFFVFFKVGVDDSLINEKIVVFVRSV